MAKTNRHGLSRTIPVEVKATIRRQSGFGCVICGVVFAQYEHIEPEWKDAQSHDPARMTLLCGACHDKVSRRFWSKEKVWKAKADPITFRHGECREAFDLTSPVTVAIGSMLFRNWGGIVHCPLWKFDIHTPLEPGAPPELHFPILDPTTGKLRMLIRGNELVGYVPGCFDIRAEGPKITLLNSAGRRILGMRADPPSSLRIEDLFLQTGQGRSIEVRDGGPLLVNTPDGAREVTTMMHGITLEGPGNSNTALTFDENLSHWKIGAKNHV